MYLHVFVVLQSTSSLQSSGQNQSTLSVSGSSGDGDHLLLRKDSRVSKASAVATSVVEVVDQSSGKKRHQLLNNEPLQKKVVVLTVLHSGHHRQLILAKTSQPCQQVAVLEMFLVFPRHLL